MIAAMSRSLGCGMRRLASMGAAALLAACSGGPNATPALTTTTTSESSAPATTAPAPTVAATPVHTNAAGIRTCVSSSEGMEFTCALEAGTYATEFFVPQVTYTVPSAGWASLNRQAAPGNFHLFPPGGGSIEAFDSGTTDAITILSAAVAPGTCTGEPSAKFEPTFDGLVEFLTTNPRLRIRDVRDASVGGLDGTVMDIAFGEPDGCDDGDYSDFLVGVSPSHGAFGINEQLRGVRLYLLRVEGSDAALAIEVDDAKDGGSDYGDGEDWFEPAQALIDTIVFGP
jgi:hypothetical protein